MYGPEAHKLMTMADYHWQPLLIHVLESFFAISFFRHHSHLTHRLSVEEANLESKGRLMPGCHAYMQSVLQYNWYWSN